MAKLVLGTNEQTVVPAIVVGGGASPVITGLNVTPSTSSQVITAPTGTDGYSPVNVAAVTSAIDNNIAAGNIKDGVAILGVTGNYKGEVSGKYREYELDVDGVLGPSKTTTHIMDFSGMEDVGSYILTNAYLGNTAIQGAVDMSDLITISGALACRGTFSGCTGLISVDLSSLTTISGTGSACTSMFYQCTGLTSVDLSSLTRIGGGSYACQSMFSNCTNLTSVNLSSLTTISGNSACVSMFNSCAGLTSVNLPALTTISGTSSCYNMFRNCTGLTSAKMNALNVISVNLGTDSDEAMFGGCTHLESVEFGGLIASTFTSKQTQMSNLFDSTTGSQAPNGCTVHFPSNFDPSDPNHTFDASTLLGYPTFGGSASYIHVAFDLSATE